MKVVLFCGGSGMQLNGTSGFIPKLMVTIGCRPLIWHIMRYYAHFGHKDFILCMGHHAEMIKNFFMQYRETDSNDFVLTRGGKKIDLLNSDIKDWKITFRDTGISSNAGMRLFAVRELLKNEKIFLLNYGDGLTDLYLPDMINWFMEHEDKTAALMAYHPTQSFHLVNYQHDGIVKSINHIQNSGFYINTGNFIIRREIFDYMQNGVDHVNEPFQRLIDENKLISWEHKGFWAGLDTYDDRQILEEAFTKGNSPWEVWKRNIHQSFRLVNNL